MLTEELPATKSNPHAEIHWAPVRPGRGILRIIQKRCECVYAVTEYPTTWDGRAVRMVKVGSAGSDQQADAYDVYRSHEHEVRCDCKGFERHGSCKHTLALDALVGNGWLNLHAGEMDWEENNPEPIEDSAAEETTDLEEIVPIRPLKEKVWCENWVTCGGIGVPGYDLPGYTARQLCVKCDSAATTEAASIKQTESDAELQANDDARQEVLMKQQADEAKALRESAPQKRLICDQGPDQTIF